MISEHLTVIESAKLKPVNIIQAAVADLKLRQRKLERVAHDERHYSFANRHVRCAINYGNDPLLLIALAYSAGLPNNTNKVSTQLLYSDKSILLDALMLLLQDRKEGRTHE